MSFFSRRRTVDDIVKPITRIVAELHEHAAAHDAKAEQHHGHATMHSTLAEASEDEARKASRTAGTIASLVG